ncbi:uncharacterized protein [Epargyreus clarus]|uniref:uncharacterized protein n=1 Tax=Epargyreus clarus TaxID=520877 RepID=UPI003C2AFF15
MSKLTVTNFSKRIGSPYKNKEKDTPQDEKKPIVHEEVLQKTHQEKQKEKNKELQQKATKKTAEYQSNKPSSGTFTEVVTHGAFTSKRAEKESTPPIKHESPTPPKGTNGSSSSKSLLGFPSSANDLALDAKSDLESDKNISPEVKEKVIEKLFKLVSMVQHVYESKVRVMTEFEKFKDTHLKSEVRREKEHSEQLYKLNMNFQNEVIQAIQQLKNELDLSRNMTSNLEEPSNSMNIKSSSVDFNISSDGQCAIDDINESGIMIENEQSSDVKSEETCE